MRIERAQVELSDGTVLFTAPKTDASVRTIHLPELAMHTVEKHLSQYVGLGPNALLLTGRGGVPFDLRRLGWHLPRHAQSVI